LRTSLQAFCEIAGQEKLLREWDYDKNGDLTPDKVSYGSHTKVWWLCGKGHSWQAEVQSRKAGSGCPVCGGKRVVSGVNDLRTVNPMLAAEWHPAKNIGVDPSAIAANSHRSVWWRCEKGHEWQATVNSRNSGAGCPVCMERRVAKGENDLAARYPALASEWHPEKNGTFLPSEVVPGSHRKVWWICSRGHEWYASIASRVKGCGCPVCAGKRVEAGTNDLASRFPMLAAEWHPTLNGELTPKEVTSASNRKVWWLCKRGHEFQATVGARSVNGVSCPYCSGRRVLPGFNDLATLEPLVAAQWHPTLNGSLTPKDVTTGSSRKVWWQCPAGHVWHTVVHSRTSPRYSGCPVCAGTMRVSRKSRYNMLAQSAKTK